jgi:hypothetical protein
MTEAKRQFMEALENGKAYDFMANHYPMFSHNDLKDIVLELLYEMGKHEENDISAMLEEMKEQWNY